jgi:hypothetical protein
MALTIDCGEGRHAPICRGAGTEHYLIPQHDDGEEFVCACKCHIVTPDPEVIEALKEALQRPQRDEAGHVPYYAGEHVPDMDEGDPEMEAWMDSLPPVDIDRLARDLKQAEVVDEPPGTAG